jgi:hypothetical protein
VTPGQAEIELTFPGDTDAARDAVVLAFEQALYESANPSLRRGANRFRVIATTSLRGRTARIRARFVQGDAPGETAIVLSGYHRELSQWVSLDRPAVSPGPSEAITSTCTRTCATFWARMQRVVEALRAEGAEFSAPGGGSLAEE